jgi:hypothetical protein
MESWWDMLQECFKEDGQDFSKMVCTLTDRELKEKFDSGYGGHEGKAFTAWGKAWVYFPIVYDGAEWVGHAPRNPCDISMNHQEGE